MVSVAGGLWAAVGLVLSCVGLGLLWRGSGIAVYLLGALGVALGTVKGAVVLGRIAERNVQRIQRLPDASPIWQVYRLRGWAFIAGMMGLGMLLRRISATMPGMWGTNALGTIDLAVGIALVVGAVRYQTVWNRSGALHH